METVTSAIWQVSVAENINAARDNAWIIFVRYFRDEKPFCFPEYKFKTLPEIATSAIVSTASKCV